MFRVLKFGKYSKFRVALFAALLGAIVFMGGRHAFAQPAPAPAGGAATGGSNIPKVGILDTFGLLMQELKHGDFVLITVIILSIAGMTFIIQGFMKARASVMFPEASTNHIRELIANRQFKELIEFTETDPSFVSKALNPALKRAPSFAAMKEAMETAVGEQTAENFRKIEYLNVIGNLGPLLGLLGTVIGMIISFESMQRQGGQANPAVLAGGISKALAHTMAGLILALPCLACFGVLRTMIDRLTVQGALLAEELLLMVKPAEAKPGATAAGAPRPGMAPVPGAPMPAAPAIRKAPQPPLPNV
jgi:biopolymer transport protein ExbB